MVPFKLIKINCTHEKYVLSAVQISNARGLWCVTLNCKFCSVFTLCSYLEVWDQAISLLKWLYSRYFNCNFWSVNLCLYFFILPYFSDFHVTILEPRWVPQPTNRFMRSWTIFFFFFFFGGGIFFFFFVQYSALLHLPPLRFHCADGCWDRTQDRCNLCIGSQSLAEQYYMICSTACIRGTVSLSSTLRIKIQD
jgi:hypothetical protein